MNQNNTPKVISIICPLINEEESIPIFYERLQAAIKPLKKTYDFELFFTNNRSTDRSLEIIKDICKNDSMVNVLTLTRNFGYQRSMLAGLNQAKGDIYIFIDVDCEDPPEMIPEFIEYWEQGYDIVYGLRDKREEPKIIEYCRKLFYRILNAVIDNESILDMAEFSLFSKDVRDVIISNKSTYPFIRNEIAYVGLKQKGIRYNRQKRAASKTYYNLIGMFQFAIAGILTASTFPLRLIMYLSIPIFFTNLVILYQNVFGNINNYMDIIILLDLMFIVFSVPLISIYLARIYHDVIGRPNFIIDWKNSIISKGHNEDVKKENHN